MIISVVVPALNEEKLIEKTLKSLRLQTVDHELIVVDNGSTDGTAKIAKKYADKVLKLKKRGVAGARNLGAKNAGGDVIVSADADCVYPETWLESLVEPFRDSSVVITSGPSFPADGDFADNLVYSSFLLAKKLLGKIDLNFGLAGCNMAFRKSHFQKVGGYRENIRINEDFDILQRLSKLGKSKFVPSAKVFISMRKRKKIGFLQYYLKYHTSWLHYSFFGEPRSGYDEIR